MKKTITKSILYMSVFTIWSFLISCIFAVTLFANNPASAQSFRDVVITIEFDNATLLEAFEEIEDKTEFTFLYHKSAVETSPKRINIKRKTASVANILQNIMVQTGLRFNQINGTIAVKFPGDDKQVQAGSITGTVTNQDGEPVPTANVLLVEIGRGAATNLEGEYAIEDVPAGTYTLRISYIGYQEYRDQVTIEAEEVLIKNVTLQTGAVGLQELVVTGYGVETRGSLTASIASVPVEEMENVPVQNTGGLLQGRAAGVQVTSTSGSPGSGFQINIRGVGSINAAARPLYIVDGVQLSFSGGSTLVDQSPLNGIDPGNIASIEVLKDAAATAIYGAQGANGVVLITTKSGTTGPTQVSASVSRGVTGPITPIEMMNTDQWLEWFTRGYMYTYQLTRDQAINRVQSELLAQYGYPANTPYSSVRDFNWIDFIYRPGSTAGYDLSFSGGNEKTQFYIAGGYEQVEGHIKSSSFNRYSLRTNFDHQINSNFSVGVNLGLTNSLIAGICQDGDFIGCPVSGALFEPPVSYPYLENGAYNPNVRFGLRNNLAVVLNEQERTSEVSHLIGNISGTYNFSPALSLKTQLGLDYRNIRNKLYSSPIAAPNDGGDIFSNVEYITSFNTSIVLSFRQTFDRVHNFSGLLGSEYRRDFTRQIGASGIGLPGGIFEVLSATAEPESVGGFEDEFRIAGYFANLKYDYDQRYLISVTGRYDGSSRFGSENRWGFFPAVSAAWRISEEDFFTSEFLESLKLRVSYGVAGNSLIGLYEARGLYGVTGSYAGITGLAPIQLANPILTWEESISKNIGLDFILFDGRLSGTVNVYQKNNQALLLGAPLPSSTSFQSITRNIGEVRNRGAEFSLHTINVTAGNFLWSTRFNIALVQNEVLELSEGVEMLFPTGQIPIAVGHSINTIQRIEWAGVNPVDGRPMWYNAEGKITYFPVPSDATLGESGAEDVIGGFGNTISYKGLSLNIFFQFSFGKTAMPNTVWDLAQTQLGAIFGNGIEAALTKSWQEPGDLVGIPSPQIGVTTYPGTAPYSRSAPNYTSAAFFDASYIRLKHASLSYSLSSSVTETLNVNSVSLFLSGSNLLTWTSYIGFDPEQAVVLGHSSYPAGQSINGGIEVQF